MSRDSPLPSHDFVFDFVDSVRFRLDSAPRGAQLAGQPGPPQTADPPGDVIDGSHAASDPGAVADGGGGLVWCKLA
jgi:hypothetical protein